MKRMKRFITEIMAAFAMLAWSCGGPVELDRPIKDTGTGEQGGPDGAKGQKSLYVTGIEYPDGYDWRQDWGYNAERCRIFLMKDGKRTVEADVGYSCCISADADMHRCIGGHLYTDFSTDMETVVKRDGTELFRYFGREMVVGMIVRDDGVYTLGQPRSGNGWTYRKNGEIMLYKGSGNLVSGLHEDKGKLYFAYEDQLEAPSGAINRYYLVENAKPSAIQTADDVVMIYDVMMINGTLHFTARLKNMTQCVLFRGPDCKAYEMGTGTAMRNCRIAYSSGHIFTYGELCVNGRYEDCFWRDTEIISKVAYPMKATGWCIDAGKLYHAVNTKYAGTLISECSETLSQPVPYDFLYANAIAADNGRCCAGITGDAAGSKPALWVDGEITDYGFNGVFTSVSYW